MITEETTIQMKVADYLTLQYPNIIFHSDFGSGVKLNKVQAALQKRLNGGRKSYPDMFVAKTRLIKPAEQMEWHFEIGGSYAFSAGGLYIELKKDGTKLIRDKDAKKFLKGDYKWRKKGDWWNLHIEEQAIMLEQLRKNYYCAEFAVGYDEATRIIDKYLEEYKNEKVEF